MTAANRSRFFFCTRKIVFVCLFSFFFFSTCFVSAQPNIKISGTVHNTKQGMAVLIIDKQFVVYNPETIQFKVNDGHFEVSAHLDKSMLVEIVGFYWPVFLFAEPGDDILFSFREGDSTGTSFTFAGKGAEQNAFLKKFYGQFKNDFDDNYMQAKMRTTGVDAFEMSLFDSRRKQNDFFKKDPDKNSYSPAFQEFIQQTITYRYWNMLLSYPITNANSNSGLTVNALPGAMLDDFEKVQLNIDAALISEPYREFLKYDVVYFTSKANGFNKFTDLSLAADRKLAYAKEHLKGEAFKFWLTRFTMDECGRISSAMSKKLLESLKEVEKDGPYTSIATAACSAKMSQKKEKEKEEKPVNVTETKKTSSDELDLKDVDGKRVSLSDFKGKVVYIDFWASWCGPCRRMMPASKELHEQLNDKQKKQIVFLYISIDADAEAWKKAMNDMGIKGVNVISPGNWNSKACRYFKINSIPRYMIMNKKGDIVDFDAKRPADSSVMDDLLKLLME